DLHPKHRGRLVGSCFELRLHHFPPSGKTLPEFRHAHPVDAGRAVIGLNDRICRPQVLHRQDLFQVLLIHLLLVPLSSKDQWLAIPPGLAPTDSTASFFLWVADRKSPLRQLRAISNDYSPLFQGHGWFVSWFFGPSLRRAFAQPRRYYGLC